MSMQLYSAINLLDFAYKPIQDVHHDKMYVMARVNSEQTVKHDL